MAQDAAATHVPESAAVLAASAVKSKNFVVSTQLLHFVASKKTVHVKQVKSHGLHSSPTNMNLFEVGQAEMHCLMSYTMVDPTAVPYVP